LRQYSRIFHDIFHYFFNLKFRRKLISSCISDINFGIFMLSRFFLIQKQAKKNENLCGISAQFYPVVNGLTAAKQIISQQLSA